MAQKVLINGTAYAVAGGDTLVSGTKYQIGGGKTLIGGTGYDIVLQKKYTVTITGTLFDKSCVKTSTGTYSTTGSFEVEDGETITVVAGAKRSMYLSSATIYLNGTRVADGQNVIGATYSMIVTSDVNVRYSQGNAGFSAYNIANITT